MKKTSFSAVLLWTGLAVTFALMVGLVSLWISSQRITPPLDQLIRLKGALEQVTQRAVTTDGYSLEIQTADVQELAVMERTFQSIIKYETRFLGAKSTLILRGSFLAKAGFDLSEASSFSLQEGEIVGQLGPARLLSVEMLEDSFELFHAQQTALNQLQAQDHIEATRLLLAQARRDAQQSTLLLEAEARVKQRLGDLSGLSLGEDPL